MKIETTIIYKAVDGSEYRTEKECREAEKNFVPPSKGFIQLYELNTAEMLEDKTKDFFNEWNNFNTEDLRYWFLTHCDAIYFKDKEWLDWFCQIVLPELEIDPEKVFLPPTADDENGFMLYNAALFQGFHLLFNRNPNKLFFLSEEHIKIVFSRMKRWKAVSNMFSLELEEE